MSKNYKDKLNQQQIYRIIFYSPILKVMSSASDPFKIHQTDENASQNLFTQYNQDADIHPNQLSGDQNSSKSILVSTIQSGKANFGLTVTTIIKTVIGSGILAMPFTISKMGWVVGLIVFVLAGAVTQFGSILLLKAKNLSRHSNFSTIFYEIWKHKFAKGLGSIVIFLNNIGICIAQLIIFKSSIRKILVDILPDFDPALDQFYTNPIFLVLIMALLQTPLTLVKKMERLKFMALSGVAGIVIFMVTFVIFFITTTLDDNPLNNPVGDMRLVPNNWFKAAAAVPNILLALSYQMNFFPVFKGMKNVSDKRMSNAVLVGVTFCSISYLIIGILGYDYVGNAVSANFLQSLEYNKVQKAFFFIINFGFLLSIFFAFPIMFFGCRNNFIAIIQLIILTKKQLKQTEWRQGDEIEHISSYIKDTQRNQRKRKASLHFIFYTIAIYLVIVGVAVGVDDIQAVFNVIGAVCSSSIGILLPCFFYFKLIDLKKQKRKIKYYFALVIFAVMTPYSLFSIVALYVQI